MGNWGDDWDPEVINREEPKGRFTINFKKIAFDMDKLVLETGEVNDKHPKYDLLLEWAGALTGCFILFLLSYQVFAFVTLPFCIFYIIAIVKIGSAWKQFKYKIGVFWAMTIGAILVLATIAVFIQHLLGWI